MVETWAFAEAKVTACLERDRRSSEYAVNRNVVQVRSKHRSDGQIRVNLEKDFAHACVKEHLVNITVSYVAIGVEHNYDLLA
jgi:hypothetical protein